MRNLRELDKYRIINRARLAWTGGWAGDETCGAFEIRSERSGNYLKVIASSDGGWDHVSVSLEKRPPSWAEMEQIKRLFFRDGETAMQLHVPPSQHINCHPNCLHLWRPHDQEIPLPPSWMVGPQLKEETDGKAEGQQESPAHGGEDGGVEGTQGAAQGAQDGAQERWRQ